jgi:hypothetical protein
VREEILSLIPQGHCNQKPDTFVREILKILSKLNVKHLLDIVDSLTKLLLASTQ